MHPFAIDADGDLFVDLGSATNACEEKNRMPQSPGKVPCKELETRGGIWRYDANKPDQHFSPAERFATGLRNGEGISFDASGRIFATQHGRNQLLEDWPQLYKPKQGQNLPAEELVQLERGADYGWPECYFDNDQQKLVLAPEYGGDGGKKVGVCAQKWPPVAFFPAHWAPNICRSTTERSFRRPIAAAPSLLSMAPGIARRVPKAATMSCSSRSSTVSPPAHTWSSPTALRGPPTPTFSGNAFASSNAVPPEGIHPEAGNESAALPTPPGATKEQVALGDRIFRGEVDSATCGGVPRIGRQRHPGGAGSYDRQMAVG